MVEAIDIAGIGRVAEWFKAAVLKTAVMPVTKSAIIDEKQTNSAASPGDLHAKSALFRENKSGLAKHEIRHSLFPFSPLPYRGGEA